jgi:hypothetical protein
MYHQVNIHQFYVLPTQCISVFVVDLSKRQRLFLYTTKTGWFLQGGFNPLKPSGYYMYHQFNIQQFFVLPHSVFIYVYGYQNKQRLFPYTALTDWFL